MIKYIDSNVFNANADAIVNTVNCVGFMGKGLAFEFSLRYPKLLEQYVEKCEKKEIKVGEIFYYQDSDKLIINFPTKNDYKFPSKLSWIESGLKNLVDTYKYYNIKVLAMPPLGCGYGGLNRKDVFELIEKYLGNLDIEVLVCLDKINPEGKEYEMITNFKNISIDKLSNYIKLNNKQKNNLKITQKTIKRFYDISNTEGIGLTTYKSIHEYFYKKQGIDTIDYSSQLTLF